jgi:hypothetical protein
VVKCSEVLQCSDGLSNKASNIIRRHGQYKVVAYIYFTIITFFRILLVLFFYQCIYGFIPV